MKERLEEIYEGLKERLKSPFLLTFIVVWIIHNWEFVYALLTFNSNMNYINRVAFLKAYLLVHDYNELLWYPLFWSFGSLGIYFIGSFFSEGINLIYSKWIRTWLYMLIDRNKLKTEDDYNLLEARRRTLQELVFDLNRKEEDASVKLRTTEQVLNKEINELKEKISLMLQEKSTSEKTVLENEKEIASHIKESEGLKGILKSKEAQIKSLEEKNTELEKFKNGFITNSSMNKPNYDRDKKEVISDIIKTRETTQKFREVFSGNWINQFELPNGQTSNEKFHLSDENARLAFITNNNEKLFISDIKFFDNTKLIFTKTNEKNPNKKMLNELTINTQTSISGTENDIIKISYSKLDK